MQFYCQNHSKTIGMFASVDTEEVLFAVGDDAMASGAPGAMSRILVEAAATVKYGRDASDEWPSQLASSVAARLAVKREDEPSCVIFSSAAITRDAVHICTAGDTRVHLVKNGKIQRWTRDHVLENESPEWARSQYGDIPLSDHSTMLTRTLGMCSLPPDTYTWNVTAPFTVLVCSSGYHQRRAPEIYIQELIKPVFDGSKMASDGVTARIDV